MRNRPEAAAPTELELQVDATAVEGIDMCVSLELAAGLAADRSEMALRWLHRWRLHYLTQVPDLKCVGEKTVAVSVTVDPHLMELLGHYPGCSAAKIASAVVSAEGRLIEGKRRRDRLIMEGRYDYDATADDPYGLDA